MIHYVPEHKYEIGKTYQLKHGFPDEFTIQNAIYRGNGDGTELIFHEVGTEDILWLRHCDILESSEVTEPIITNYYIDTNESEENETYLYLYVSSDNGKTVQDERGEIVIIPNLHELTEEQYNFIVNLLYKYAGEWNYFETLVLEFLGLVEV